MPKGRPWTEEDDKFLLSHYSLNGAKMCALNVNRTQEAVVQRAFMLGIIRRGRIKDLSLGEIDGYYVIKGNGETYFLHRMIMERELNRKLTADDIVHHIDGDTKNNNPSNLSLETRSSHMQMHCEERRDSKTGQFT